MGPTITKDQAFQVADSVNVFNPLN